MVRLPFSNEMLHAKTPAPGSINFDLNPSLQGKSPLEVLDDVVRELGRRRVAVVLNNHTTFGAWCGGPDANGLWFLSGRQAPWGPQSEAQWIEDWAMLAARYARCPQVMGYDLRNEVRAAPGRRGPLGLLPWLRWPVWDRKPAADADAGPGAECSLAVHADWAAAAAACAERLQEVNGQALIIVERIVWPQRGLADYISHPLLPRFAGKLVLAVHSYSWSGPGLYLVRWGVPESLWPLARVLGALGVITWRNHGDMAASGDEELEELMRKEWGFVLEQECCPVWVSEFGCNLTSHEEMVWLRSFVEILRDLDADWAYWPLNVGDKPAGGGDESYGMLTSRWEAPPEGSDKRLTLLRSIMKPLVDPRRS